MGGSKLGLPSGGNLKDCCPYASERDRECEGCVGEELLLSLSEPCPLGGNLNEPGDEGSSRLE